MSTPDGHTVYAGIFHSGNQTTSVSEGAVCNGGAPAGPCAVDLGNPDDIVKPDPNPMGPIGGPQSFHPLKGPMTTQTLRGLRHQGPMHWRGDRTGGTFSGDPQALDAGLAFGAFNVAFDGVQVLGGPPGAQAPGGLPAPNANSENTPGPETGLIVKFNRTSNLWEDQLRYAPRRRPARALPAPSRCAKDHPCRRQRSPAVRRVY